MVRNVLSSWGALILVAGINFMLAPLVVHGLGNDAYGAWVLLTSLVGYLGLFDLGVRGAVTKFVATYHAQSDHEAASRIGAAALTLFSGAGLLAIATSQAFAVYGLRFFDIGEHFLEPARFVVRMGGVTIAITIIGGVYGGIVVGRQRLDLLNLVSLAIELVRASSLFLVLQAGGGIAQLALIQFGVAVTMAVASYGLSRRVYPDLRLRLFRTNTKDMRTILSFGVFATLLHVGSTLINYSDSLVIGAYLPVGFITFFAISANLVEQARSLVGGISRAIAPLAGAMDGRNDTTRIGDLLVEGARYATLVSLPIALTFILRGRTFITLWMGEAYAEPASTVLVMLSIGLWVYAGFQVCCGTLIGLNRHRGLVPAFLVEAGVNVAISIALVRTHGLYGVALGTLIPRLVMCLVFGPWYCRLATGVAPSRLLTQSLVRPSLAMVPFALTSWLIERFWPAGNLAIYFAQVAAAMPFAALGAWLVFFSSQERERYGALLGSFIRRGSSSIRASIR